MPVIPESLEFIGKKDYEIIFQSILPENTNKCFVEVVLTNLDQSSTSIFNFVVPNDSQSCSDGCDDRSFKQSNTFYTTIRLDDLIIGNRYKMTTSMQCAN